MNALNRLKISVKLNLGFSIAVLTIVGLVAFSLISMNRLAGLQDDGATRAKDAVLVTEVDGTVPRLYQIIADGIINRNLDATLDDWKAIKAEMESDLKIVADAADTPEEKQLSDEGIAAYHNLVAIFETEMLPVLRTSEQLPDIVKQLDARLDSEMGVMENSYDQIRKSIIAEAEEADAQFDAVGSRTITIATIIAVVATIILLLTATLTSRSIVTPIRAMTAFMTRLAEGDKTQPVPATDRVDEIGEMASAVQVFKENMIKADELAEQQKQDQQARQRRAEKVDDLTKGFDASVAEILATVTAATNQMESTAASMSATAEETSKQATAVAAASEQASTNVQTVASATEELTGSIQEISRQVSRSSEITTQAVDQTHKTQRTVQALSESADRIGEVVELITDIAEQTNLLALNATIEAARAGDAGKGFAVVASEVKNLANQTAKATEEIGSQISGVQDATKEAVEAIEGVATIITEINSIATTIASAIEEQQAATQEISRNVEQAAAGTQEVSSNILTVNQAADDTGAASTQVLDASRELSRKATGLKDTVEQFLNDVRSA